MVRSILRSTTVRGLLAACCVINLSLPWSFGLTSSIKQGNLRKGDRARLAGEYAGGSTEVMLLIAAKQGANASLVREIEGRGGKIRYREDSVDYLRANVPIAQVEKIANLDSVQCINVGDDTIYYSGARESANDV